MEFIWTTGVQDLVSQYSLKLLQLCLKKFMQKCKHVFDVFIFML